MVVNTSTNYRKMLLFVASARTKADWLAAAQVDLIGIERTADSLKSELCLLLQTGDTALVPEPFQSTPDSLPVWIQTINNQESRPELLSINQNVKQLEATTSALWSSRLPLIAAKVGYRFGRPGINMGTYEYMDYAQAGIQVQWNLYDGLKNRAQREQVSTQMRILELQRSQLVNQWQTALYNQTKVCDALQQQYRAARLWLESAQAYAADCTNGLSAGTITATELTNALSVVAAAQLKMDQIVLQYTIALLQVRFNGGEELLF